VLFRSDFLRARIGIGRPPGQRDPIDYVLGTFAKNQREDLGVNIAEAADAVEQVLSGGLESAQNKFNH
jgi:PTH1 family peptidyl-tRNA hydrolase